jgi:hypothetical protein
MPASRPPVMYDLPELSARLSMTSAHLKISKCPVACEIDDIPDVAVSSVTTL